MAIWSFSKVHTWEEAVKEPEKVRRLSVYCPEFHLHDYSRVFQRMKNVESIFLHAHYLYEDVLLSEKLGQ